jgi:hypothetical protein
VIAIIPRRWLIRLTILAASLTMLATSAMLVAGCHAIYTVRELRASSAPDISRVMLKNGKVTIFNADFGWYNLQAGTIEGVTVDSQHVEYHLSEISKVETVREYSIFPAAVVAVIALWAGLYLLAEILTHFQFLR